MKKAENCLEITLTLPKTYKRKLVALMEDEFLVASRKWGLKLNTEDKKRIFTHSIAQLEGKVFLITGTQWKSDDPTLVLEVATQKGNMFPIIIPSKEAEELAISLVRSHDEWRIDSEPNSEAVLLKDFYSFFLAEMEKWIRTAVFYGVGSYT
jgi:hypothetical protein